MRVRTRVAPLLILLLMSVWPRARAEEALVTRLEADHVDITSQFAGQELLLFGSVSRGCDLIIKVVSPEQQVALSRKVKIGPVWLDSGHMTVQSTPGLMYLLSSRPVDRLLGPVERARYGLRLDDALGGARVSGVQKTGMGDWQSAFLRLKREKGYYTEDGRAVTVDKGRLFFASITLPPKLPLGEYRLEIYSVRNGEVVRHETDRLEVREVRLEHWVDSIAHGYPWAFGSVFTAGVMVLGLGLGIVLRRKRGA
jgi:uncharacterized protein (TIGR02186 family)